MRLADQWSYQDLPVFPPAGVPGMFNLLGAKNSSSGLHVCVANNSSLRLWLPEDWDCRHRSPHLVWCSARDKTKNKQKKKPKTECFTCSSIFLIELYSKPKRLQSWHIIEPRIPTSQPGQRLPSTICCLWGFYSSPPDFFFVLVTRVRAKCLSS